MIDESTTLVETPVPEKKQRGNPNWVKKSDFPEDKQPAIKRAGVVSESAISDIWEVRNKDPEKHYTWARKDQDYEMNMLAQKSYVPARGKEKILGDPFAAVNDTDGQTKVRGERILMCCPKEMVTARRKEQAERYTSVKKSSESEARRMRQKGVAVESLSSSETKRESADR